MPEENIDEFFTHVKQGAIEVGTDIFQAAATFISEVFNPDYSGSEFESSYDYDSYGTQGGYGKINWKVELTNGRQMLILDENGSPLQKIGDNVFRLNDNTNLVITKEGIRIMEADEYYGDYAYDQMGGASPFMVYGLLFSCLISLMILFAIMIKRRRMMIHRRYLHARNSLATAADFAVVDSELPPAAAAKKNVNDAPPSYETVTEQDKMLPKYEEV